MTAATPESAPLQRLLEFASELQRLRSIVLGEAIPSTLRDENEEPEDDPSAEMAAFLNPIGLVDPRKRLSDTFVQLRALHLTEPTVAEVLLSFLVGLGKGYGETEDGEEALAGLHRSESAEELRRLWVALSLNTVDVEPTLSARSWAETVLDLSLTGEMSEIGRSLRPEGLA